MIDTIKNAATSYEFLSMLALFTFWVPLTICLTVYLFRFVAMYKKDLQMCSEMHYRPSLTLGKIVWYLSISIIPGINLFTLVFDCASSLFKWLGRVLDFPLVRARVK